MTPPLSTPSDEEVAQVAEALRHLDLENMTCGDIARAALSATPSGTEVEELRRKYEIACAAIEVWQREAQSAQEDAAQSRNKSAQAVREARERAIEELASRFDESREEAIVPHVVALRIRAYKETP